MSPSRSWDPETDPVYTRAPYLRTPVRVGVSGAEFGAAIDSLPPDEREHAAAAWAFRCNALIECEPERVEQPRTGMNAPQPPPIDTDSPAVWPMVIADVKTTAVGGDIDPRIIGLVVSDMRARDEAGRAKYGVPLRADNGRDHLIDSLQEAYDCAVYNRAAIEHMAATGNRAALLTRAMKGVYELSLTLAITIRSAIAIRDNELIADGVADACPCDIEEPKMMTTILSRALLGLVSRLSDSTYRAAFNERLPTDETGGGVDVFAAAFAHADKKTGHGP